MKNKMFYILAYNILAKRLPISYHFPPAKIIRAFWARKILKSAGKNINIERGAVFSYEVSIGDNSGIGVNCEIYGPVEIGENVMMGPETVIYTRNHKHDKLDMPMNKQGFEDYEPVKIGNDVWISKRVIILPGVTIGDGCIIGAGAVVAKNIDPYSIAVGNPARVVKKRNQIVYWSTK
ncbi:MAG TPA: DapH/DapD/GlmU-related protein [Candidatus Paceibacterota bacterium]